MAEIIQIEKNGIKQYPVTTPDAIIDANGNMLSTIINSKKNKWGIENNTETSISLTISPNIIYNCTSLLNDISILSFNVSSEPYDEYMILFKSDTATSISLPSDVYWANGEIPQIEADTEYELSITKRTIGDSNIFKAILVPFKTVT